MAVIGLEIEAKLKQVRHHLRCAKELKEEAARELAKVWEAARPDQKTAVEVARNRLANSTVDLLHAERFLKEILK